HAGGATLWYLFAKERINPYYNPKFPFDCNIHVSTHTIAGSPYNISIAPNPSRGLVDISFGLSSSQHLTIEVFDLNGKPIRVLAQNQSYQPGSYRLHLDATEVPDGVYIISFQSTSGKVTEKLVVSH
ncbi:MAG: T9SS type A sorting domain-containing protein, partial [Saprospiraceae bacterium]